MQVSVIVPVYNTAKYVARCLDSLIGQTHGPFEVIVVDDGSPDSAANIVEQHARGDSRIRLVRQANQGLSAARNTGIELASGECLLFLDSDDTLQLDALERLVAVAKANNSDVVLPDRYLRIPECTGTATEELHFDASDWLHDPREFATRVMIAKGRAWRATSVLYRSCLIRERRIRFPRGVTSEDIVFNLSYFAAARRVDFVGYPTLANLKRAGSITQSYHPDLVDSFLSIDRHVAKFLEAGGESTEMRAARDSLLCRNIAIFITLEMSRRNPMRPAEKRERVYRVLSHERVREAFANPSFIAPYWSSAHKRLYVTLLRRMLHAGRYRCAVRIAELASRLVRDYA